MLILGEGLQHWVIQHPTTHQTSSHVHTLGLTQHTAPYSCVQKLLYHSHRLIIFLMYLYTLGNSIYWCPFNVELSGTSESTNTLCSTSHQYIILLKMKVSVMIKCNYTTGNLIHKHTAYLHRHITYLVYFSLQQLAICMQVQCWRMHNLRTCITRRQLLSDHWETTGEEVHQGGIDMRFYGGPVCLLII